jgi:tripartite-type tricarboxylate transporter receptor subunit TctC
MISITVLAAQGCEEHWGLPYDIQRNTTMHTKREFLHIARLMVQGLIAFALAAAATPAAAQTWPQRTVKFVVPLGPGSGTDIGARLLADRLAARWGRPVVVENRPGGDGIVAINAFISADDDHTLLFAPSGTFTVHPFTREKVPYDVRDLVPIARVSNTIVGIAVPGSLKAGSLADLVALARAQPGKLNWSPTSGMTDIVTSSFLKSSDLDVVRVPYRDSVQGLNDLIEGRLQIYVTALAIVRSQADAGRIKILALTNRERATIFPDVPTAIEAGFPTLALEGLVGLFGPRRMSNELRERIAVDVRAVTADPAVAARLETTGQIINIGSPAEFAASIEEQRLRIATAAKDLGLKPAQ